MKKQENMKNITHNPVIHHQNSNAKTSAAKTVKNHHTRQTKHIQFTLARMASPRTPSPQMTTVEFFKTKVSTNQKSAKYRE